MKAGSTWTTHQGGTVVHTRTGLIHTAGRAYSGQLAQEQVPVKKTKKG